jgi:hypothetical protein
MKSFYFFSSTFTCTLLLIILVHLNLKTNKLQKVLLNQTQTNTYLQKIVSQLEDSIHNRKIVIAEDTILKSGQTREASSKSTQDSEILTKNKPVHKPSEADTVTPQENTFEAGQKPTINLLQYLYGNKEGFSINQNDRISSISVLIIIKKSTTSSTDYITANVNYSEIYDDKATVARQSLLPIKLSVDRNNSVRCIFQEQPQPETNQYGLPNYQRKLSLMITGNLESDYLDGDFVWQEENGRPQSFRCKINLVRKSNSSSE